MKRKQKRESMKQFKDLKTYMNYVEGVSYLEAKKMKNFPTGLLVEEHNDYLTIVACAEGFKLAKDFAEKNNLNIMTETIDDLENGDACCILSNEIHLVNRERFYFSKNKKKAVFIDRE